jgi:hypothetical protein
MSPQRFGTINHALFALAIGSFLGIFVLSALGSALGLGEHAILWIMGLMMGCFFVCILTLLVLPFAVTMRCDKVGCNGTMQRVWGQGPNCSRSLSYRCGTCGETYDTHVNYGGGSDF